MTTQAPTPPAHPRPVRAAPPPASASEANTQPLTPTGEELVNDAARLLDHRTRRLAIRRRSARAGAYLALDDGDGQPWLLPLTAPVTHVGRGGAADLRIEERRISRHHAIVVRHGRSARLLDNRSANGTWLNGRPIVAANLSDGDLIRIGPVVLRYLELR